MTAYAQVVIRDQGTTYQPGDEVPESVIGFDELVEAGSVADSYTSPERSSTDPDISDLTPTSPPQDGDVVHVTDSDSAGTGEETG
jgi:hypothetical protein